MTDVKQLEKVMNKPTIHGSAPFFKMSLILYVRMFHVCSGRILCTAFSFLQPLFYITVILIYRKMVTALMSMEKRHGFVARLHLFPGIILGQIS
jgi:uncharacterized membrane protein